MSGCGGGGDSQATATVSIANVLTEPIGGSYLSDDDASAQTFFQYDVVGDKGLLKANGVFVRVDDPAGLFNAHWATFDWQAGRGLFYISAYVPFLPVGSSQGAVKVWLCADEQCKMPLAGSPVTVPYSIHVSPGLAFNQLSPPYDEITIESSFGEVTDLAAIPLTVPDGTTSISVSPELGGRRGQSVFVEYPFLEDKTAVAARAELLPTPKLILTGQLRPVGTYYTIVTVTANYAYSTGEQAQTTKKLVVTYKVNDAGGTKYLLDPARLSFEVSPQIDSTSSPIKILGSGGGIASYSVEYLPPDGSGNLDAGPQAWLELNDQSVMQTLPWHWTNAIAIRCNVFVGEKVECLAPGRYEAILHLKVWQADGSTLDVPMPMSLSVKP
ncbi:hypothetical protein DZC73_00215 [Albitalea terrae]|uniref:Uncharacterized protein n=2 Tax=Piscinibacter terrae TaxID=2496871 RepID=A0A3N7K3P3_9BURK|nr:hypothetical protein DZC73_00215 [Albitalea terrae]